MIKKSEKVIVPADKTSNYYEIDKADYKKLVRDSVTAKYTIDNTNIEDRINQEAKEIAKKLDLADRVEVIANNEAFINLKDHKENFQNNPKVRLINPAKTEIGKICKEIVQQINEELREKTKLKQWRNTEQVIEWFKAIDKKQTKQFLQLDIEEFYPSITENNIDKAMEFANKHTNLIDQEVKNIIKAASRSILFSNGKAWTKTNQNIDISMGAYAGAEICELVGLHILDQIRTEFPDLNMGLYRDDGLACHETKPGPELEKMKKKIIKIFKANNLKITIETNLSQVNFLDVTFDIKRDKYWPYKKPNDATLYIHKDSNHPKNVIKELPKSVNKRLSTISSDRNVFEKNKTEYQEALEKSGFTDRLEYKEYEKNKNEKEKKNKRKRKILWYNPPFNAAVKSNIAKQFLCLIEKHFPKSNKLSKIINKNKVKCSYSCTKNMETIIRNHNNKILKDPIAETEGKKCNCRSKKNCPLNDNCKAESIIYKATVNETENYYFGSTEGEFKTRYNNHTHSFRKEDRKNDTTLAKHIWEKNLNPIPEITWQIAAKAHKYKPGNKYCDICLMEKMYILQHLGNDKCLNKNSEFGTLCIHKRKHKLSEFKK